MSSSAAEMNTCSISVEPMPSMSLTPVASWNSRQVDSGRDRAPQTPQALDATGAQHGAVRGGGGEADRDAVAFDDVGQFVGGGLLDEQRGRAGPQREHDQPAQPEGERQR